MNNEIRTLELFSGVLWQAQMIKNLLENAGIDSFLQDELVAGLNLPWAAPGGQGQVTLIIAESDYENARLVVEEYQKNLGENPL